MGRRKGQIASMANCQLVKDKQRRTGRRHGDSDSFLHTTDIQDGADYNRINFQSVTEQSNLEDFLTTAEMAGKDFTAERQNVQVITNPGQGVKLTEEDMMKIHVAQDTHRSLLQIPRRPQWDKTTTKEDLIMMERDAFTNWRRQLKMLEEKDHIHMTPYEKNLDFWRQLWRVIERSDVVVQIVDARNPLLFRCEDLEEYVKEVDPSKRCMLLINKADFLNSSQRQEWVDFFNRGGITAVFFSAKAEQEKLESSSEPGLEKVTSETDYYDEDLSDSDDDEYGSDHKDSDTEKDITAAGDYKSQASVGNPVINSDQITPDVENLSLNTSATAVRPAPPLINCGTSEAGTFERSDQLTTNEESKSPHILLPHNDPPDSDMGTSEKTATSHQDIFVNSPNVVSAEELLDIFSKLAEPASNKGARDMQVIGMVGYPNVGKSSTINTILKKKKLAVSATPGRTKHLQTLHVDDHLILCDCPGLVFPSFVATKAHLVTNGILPIDELRDHVAPTALVCDSIPRNVLEATYSIMIPRPSMDEEDANRPPTAEELLSAYGAMRGFMTPRSVPDCPRASRYILKDFVKGKLLYCNPPPGVSGAEFQDTQRHQQLLEMKPQSKTAAPQIVSDIDKEFFKKKQSKAHSRGVGGVSEFVRTDTLQHSGQASGVSSSVGHSHSDPSHQTAGGVGKPWKKHNNRNKKEKLRRLHNDLDV